MSNCYVCGAALSLERADKCSNCGTIQPEQDSDAVSLSLSSDGSEEAVQSAEANHISQTSNSSIPPMPVSPQPPKRSWLSRTPAKILLAVLILIILAGGATSYYVYQMSRPEPVLSLESIYKSHSLPAGATDTRLTIKGRNFSNTSAITLLLDGQSLQGQPNITSDTNGKVESMLKISAQWTLGKHTLTAKDGNGNITQNSVPLYIVTSGEADAPGPNGSPLMMSRLRLWDRLIRA
ncbi:hypothetical protein [Ktedonospora formicarum]|uniref:IPT/TIG domain-containing protein n=1 Tax=Ktedonospora formicarum TaxID=2778364 RepID=A0A8J3MSE6_9CHLR|nr:hypothetical protein [Ktedonospora formicarum]GHO46030.1 hypothetical protein KSX_41930 [Ktedonospora formicarum]